MAIGEFRRAKFAIDALGHTEFEGFTKGDSWNGWACPYFTYEITEAVLNASENNGYKWQYDDKSHSFIVRHSDDPQEYESEKFPGINLLMEGSDIVVYAIGAYTWTWETIETV